MKKMLITVITVMLICSFPAQAQDAKVKVKKDETKIKTDKGKMKMEGDMMSQDMPYTANYSSKFIMGNQAYAKKVLELWRHYDANQIHLKSEYFADSLVVDLPNGMRISGRDEVLKVVHDYRTSQGTVESSVDAWFATKSTDKNEDWVCIWGTETATDASGKRTTQRLHEIWQFNKDGKVVYMAQFVATPPAM